MDISQDLHRARVLNVLPTIAKSSWLASVTQGHHYTLGEIDFATGWPMICVECGNKRLAAPSVRPSKSNVSWEVGSAALPFVFCRGKH